MGAVHIDPVEFRMRTGRMEDVLPGIEKTAGDLDHSVQAVGAGWKGDGHDQFTKFAADLHKGIQDLHTALRALTEALRTGDNTYGNLEGSNVDLFKQMHDKAVASMQPPKILNL